MNLCVFSKDVLVAESEENMKLEINLFFSKVQITINGSFSSSSETVDDDICRVEDSVLVSSGFCSRMTATGSILLITSVVCFVG